MTRYILHIGPPKTGSSILQSSLIHLRETLAADGIYFPTEWTEFDILCHKGLIWLLREGKQAEIATALRRFEAKGYEQVVISCEGLFGLTPEQLVQLRGVIGDQKVRVLYYVRRWSDRLPSIWNQNVRMGKSVMLPDFLRSFLVNPLRSPNFNYARIFERFADVFGRDAIELIGYSNQRDRGVDIVEHFLREILGWKREYVVPKEAIKANFSSNTTDTEVMRVLNYIRTLEAGGSDQGLREKFLAMREQLDLAVFEQAMQSELMTIKLKDATGAFDPAYASISTWRDRLVGEPADAPMFNKKVSVTEFVHPNYLIKRGIGSAYRRLYAQIDPPPPTGLTGGEEELDEKQFPGGRKPVRKLERLAKKAAAA